VVAVTTHAGVVAVVSRAGVVAVSSCAVMMVVANRDEVVVAMRLLLLQPSYR